MIGWPAIAADVVRALLGEPSTCTRTELRYGRKGSLSVDVVRGRWHDFETGEGGGVLGLVTRERGSRAAALAWLEAEGFVAQRDPGARAAESRPGCPAVETGNPTGARPCASESARQADSRRYARQIWKQTRPVAATVAEAYLEARGVGHAADAAALRFHPGLSHPVAPGRLSALVAGVQDVDGRFVGAQRTYLDGARKAAVDPVRASLGRLTGGAVRLADPVDGRLLIGEGIESTAAAVRVLDWRGAAWATLGTSGLRAVEIPAGVHDVVIAADRDPGGGGQLAAAALAGRLADEGRSVAIELPPFVGDWCDVLALARDAA